jgi:hypothetical protein
VEISSSGRSVTVLEIEGLARNRKGKAVGSSGTEKSRTSQLAGDPIERDEMKLNCLIGDFIRFHRLDISVGWVSSE